MVSATVQGFSPSTHGFHFANAFPHVPLREIKLEGIATLEIGDAANGLCGGMSYAVRDLFEHGEAPPPDRTPPVAADPRYTYLVDRQFDSFDGIAVPLRFYSLMSPTRPDREPWWAEWLGRVGIDRHSRTWIMLREEWPKIQADLNAGRLSSLGLVRVVDVDPFKLGQNHQVLAYGYDLVGSELALLIYDPNSPDDNSVRLSLDIADPRSSALPRYTGGGAPVLSFFRTQYTPHDPSPFHAS